jgi:hypothetical protein
MQMTYVTRNLLPQDQGLARQATRICLTTWSKFTKQPKTAITNKLRKLPKALADIDTFLQTVPKPPTQQSEGEG